MSERDDITDSFKDSEEACDSIAFINDNPTTAEDAAVTVPEENESIIEQMMNTHFLMSFRQSTMKTQKS